MTDETMANLASLEASADAARGKAKILSAISIILAASCVLVALVAVVFVVRDKTSGAKTTSVQIENLTKELEQARANLAVVDVATEERTKCDRAIGASTSVALSEYLATIGDLIVTITSVVPGPEREAAVAENVTLLAARLVDYRAIVAKRVAWEASDGLAACPV